MRTIRKILPGQPGTKKLLKEYGEKLICVRYRDDADRKRKLKTVELIIEELPFNKKIPVKIPPDQFVAIRLKYEEKDIQQIVKISGGRWNWDKKVWELPYREAISLGIKDRIIYKGLR